MKSLLRKLFRGFRALFQKEKLDLEMDEELRFHLKRQTEANIQAGMSPEEARYAALRRFGGVDQVKERCRDARGTAWIEHFLRDARFGLRMLCKHPGSSIVIIGTLALLMGTLNLVLGGIQHERSARMPFPHSERLVRLWRIGKERPSFLFPTSVYVALRQKLEGLECIGIIGPQQSCVVTGLGESKASAGIEVSSSVFCVAGMAPLMGRTFSAKDERSGDTPLVVLSHDAWQNHFGSDEGILGRTITVNNRPVTVVGVMPNGFERNALFWGTEMWLSGDFEASTKNQQWFTIVGRVKASRSLAQLRAELEVVAPPIMEASARSLRLDDSLGKVSAFSLDKQLQYGGMEASVVVFLTVIPLFVLLIACFNIVHILLARLMARRKELAVRSALGAARSHLIRQLLTETVVLTLGGGLFGIVGATWISGYYGARSLSAQLSPWVIGSVLIATCFIGVAAGWFPARRAVCGDAVSDLKEGGGASSGTEHHRLRNVLIAGQVAMATVLCIVAGLLVETYLNRSRFDPGFETKNLEYVVVSPDQSRYKSPEQRFLYYRLALERIRAVVGVEEVGVCTTAPIDRSQRVFPLSFRLKDDGHQWKTDRTVNLSVVSPNYLKMVNVPVLRGRPLTDADGRGSDPVVLVNQSFIARHFLTSDPIGQMICLPLEHREQWFTIVGVVPDRRNLGVREHLGAEAYLSDQQAAPEWAEYYFLARTKGGMGLMGHAIRRAVQSIDDQQPVSQPVTVVSELEKARRWNIKETQVVVAIGLFGLIMAILGIYGVVSQSVVERMHELGIRKALGASETNILGVVVKQGMKPALLGLGVGLVLAVGTASGTSQLLFGVSTLEPAVYLFVCLVFAGTTFIACVLPARRATRVDPMVALRYE